MSDPARPGHHGAHDGGGARRGSRHGGSTRPPRRALPAEPWRSLATAGLLTGAAAVVALHAVRTDLDPAGHRLSEYALGPFGWLMTLAFVAVATGLCALRRGIAAWPGLGPMRAMLAVAALGMLASAVFETDVTTPAAPRELVHSAVSSTAFASLVLAALWTSTVARDAVTWATGRAVPATVTALVALGAVVSPIAHDGPRTGLAQRLTWLAIMVWLLLLTRAARAGR